MTKGEGGGKKVGGEEEGRSGRGGGTAGEQKGGKAGRTGLR